MYILLSAKRSRSLNMPTHVLEELAFLSIYLLGCLCLKLGRWEYGLPMIVSLGQLENTDFIFLPVFKPNQWLCPQTMDKFFAFVFIHLVPKGCQGHEPKLGIHVITNNNFWWSDVFPNAKPLPLSGLMIGNGEARAKLNNG